MSELNVYHHELRPNEYAEFYLKYEADKVIADLEESHKMEVEQLLIEIAELKERVQEERSAKVNYKISANDLSDGLKDTYEEIKHHKHKRCLVMAKWCENAILGWMGHKESYSSQQRYIKVMLFTKWHNRWLELAEKFKETRC